MSLCSLQNNRAFSFSEGNIDIVCLVTSDKGYAATIRELRAQGKRVIVMGEEKAPDELRNACSKFIEI